MKLFDAHFHIIDKAFPLVANNGFIPSEFSVNDYNTRLSEIAVIGGAVVSGSFQAFDQQYLKAALNKLGENFCGVANIPADIRDSEIRVLDQSGVRAVRFNLFRGGSAELKDMKYLSQKLHDEYGWHTELYLDSRNIPDLFGLITSLPAVSIDHLGLSSDGLASLYTLVELGVRVKASGFGRLDFNPIPAMQQILAIDPKALMFGTDLPSTRAKVPFSFKDLDLIVDNFSGSQQQAILFENAIEWYRMTIFDTQ